MNENLVIKIVISTISTHFIHHLIYYLLHPSFQNLFSVPSIFRSTFSAHYNFPACYPFSEWLPQIRKRRILPAHPKMSLLVLLLAQKFQLSRSKASRRRERKTNFPQIGAKLPWLWSRFTWLCFLLLWLVKSPQSRYVQTADRFSINIGPYNYWNGNPSNSSRLSVSQRRGLVCKFVLDYCICLPTCLRSHLYLLQPEICHAGCDSQFWGWGMFFYFFLLGLLIDLSSPQYVVLRQIRLHSSLDVHLVRKPFLWNIS